MKAISTFGELVLGGWVVDVTKSQLISDLGTAAELEAGQPFKIEIFGARYDLRADGNFRQLIQNRTIFDLSNVSVSPATEAVRMVVPFYPCDIHLDNMRGEASAVDISIEGIGFLTSAKLEKGDKLQIYVTSPEGVIEVQADVRYCLATDPDGFEFRAGARLTFPDRIGQAKWMRLFANQLAA
ncbi:MAG: PilZ domain-containing protein [Chthonomonas sp.]|nr:PilZ domain-containing protein [Chthonomonas sp.]